jgi:hypothetical protein
MKKVIIAYKNFAANRNISHIGLGVAAINNSKVLRASGIAAEVWPIVNAAELRARLNANPATHVIISAPWIPALELQALINDYPDIKFAVNSHSNVGFLQADANGVRLLREAMEIETGSHNFHLAGNSRKFCQWVHDTYAAPCTYLPNMYFLDTVDRTRRPLWRGGTLRVGAFGATRPQKNFMSAAAAALEIAHLLKADLELWISAGRAEGGGEVVQRAIRAMFDGLLNARVVEAGWQSWPKFRKTVGNMHLLLQPSYTESFNMVTADGIAEGVPSVVSSAIDWTPRYWRAEIDDVFDIARVGRCLLQDPNAALEGLQALRAHNRDGLEAWIGFLV